MRIAPLLALLVSVVAGASPPARPAGRALELRFEVIENLPAEAGFRAALTLSNRGPAELPASGWQLRFNFVPEIDPASAPAGVRIARVNGDLWLLEPAPGFEPLAAGAGRRIPFAGGGSVAKASDAPAGPYFVWEVEGGRAEAAAAITVAPIPLPPDLSSPTPAARHRANAALTRLDAAAVGAIVPTPVRLRRGRGRVRLDGGWRIVHDQGLAAEAAYLAEALELRLGSRPEVVDDGPSDQARVSLWPGDPKVAPAGGVVSAASEGSIVSRSDDPGVAPADGASSAAGATRIALRLGDPQDSSAAADADAAGQATASQSGPTVRPYVYESTRDEAYRMTIDRRSGIQITGASPAGVFYGSQSLRALLRPAPRAPGPLELPEITVEDAPRFPYRGIHLDVARNFQPRAAVEKLLEIASLYKLNRFHFHLTDDEGWRLAIAGLPELTEVGGRRGHSADGAEWLPPSFGSGPTPGRAPGSGHYTRADLVAILRHASARHIEVVPEIDLPGHARAAIRSMETRFERLSATGQDQAAGEFRLRDPEDTSRYRSVQGWDDNVVNVCLPSTYRFVERVLDELVSIWAEAGAPLTAVHIGGDEVPAGVWERSPACSRLLRDSPELDSPADLPGYFVRRVAGLLAERGLATAGWEEIALIEHPEPLDRDLRPYVWKNVWGWGSEDVGYRLANAGYPVVLAHATNLYFDLAYDHHPLEPGYTWAGTVDTRRAWEMVPFDVYRAARHDRRGRPLDPARLAGKERLTAAGRRNVLGIQGQIWGENARTPAQMEYLAFPKLLGLAERAWAPPPAWAGIEDPAAREAAESTAWNEFANRLGQRELPRLDRLDVIYRLPPPGAVLVDGVLEASAAFPGLEIRYTTDGSRPGANSKLYDGPVRSSAPIHLATFDSRGRSSRPVALE